jgi:solute carrier family 25 phosphate transporter 3
LYCHFLEIPTIQFGGAAYCLLCGVAGMIAGAITHTAMVPLDLMKCRIQVLCLFLLCFTFILFTQVDKSKYKSVFRGLRVTIIDEGPRALAKGWLPTMIGYSLQGFTKFGLYELFKIVYAGEFGPVSCNC